MTQSVRGPVRAASTTSEPTVVPVVASDALMDPLDRIVGRAALQETFRSRLLNWPTDALVDERVPAGLLARLSPIWAETLAEFATIALRGYRRGTTNTDQRA